MSAVQTSYATSITKAVAGMVANSETDNRITRTAGGNIGFGLPVIRVGDHNCILATQETLEAVGAAGSPAPAGATITAAPAVGAGAKEGVYTATCTLGGATTTSKWLIEDPDGIAVGIATGNTEFVGGGLTFTITDSGTDPVVGERFTITLTPSTATADLDVLGIAIKQSGLDHTTADRYEQYDNVAILALGVIWVTAGATVVAGDPVYWNPATSRYTKTTTHLRLTGWVFDSAGADGEIVKIARR